MKASSGRIRRIACVIAASGTILAGTALSAVPAASGLAPRAAAAGDSTASYFSTPMTVKSSTHKKLHLSLSASHTETGSDLFVYLSSGGESHSWTFQESSSALSATASGHGTLKASLGKYGKISLKFSSGGAAKKSTCNSETTTSKPVKANGIFFFNTHSSGKHKWGTVGSKHSHMSVKKGTVTTFTGSSTGLCFKLPCPKPSVGFSGGSTFGSNPSGPRVSDYGNTVGSRTTLTGNRNVTLGKVTREDSITGKGKKLSVTASGGGHSVTIRSASKLISGSGVVSSSQPASTSSCKSTTTSYWSAGFTSHGLKFHAQIFGDISPASMSTGYSLYRTTTS